MMDNLGARFSNWFGTSTPIDNGLCNVNNLAAKSRRNLVEKSN